ncbi:MAG TPA: MBL fold metallo-hydrolase [Bryobacteraceae bacterium]|nr:MBL fold metallo-hydrolase [Bryobacteraceae bacterium]
MPAGSHRFHVGNLGCTVLSDGYVSNPACWYFPNANDLQLNAALESRGNSSDHVISPYTCLLIETGREVVLADAGLGDSSRSSGAILARLEMTGIRPQDVSAVVFTHAHPDHIGGAVNGRARCALHPVFPNARYLMAEAEWDFWNSTQADLRSMRIADEAKAAIRSAARECLHALRHRIDLIDGESEIAPGIRALPAPGHTPGHLALLLSSEGKQLLNLGDAATHPLHLEHPEWENGFDLEPDRARLTRRSLLERAVSEGMHVMAFHFPFPSVGQIAERGAGGWNWTPGW